MAKDSDMKVLVLNTPFKPMYSRASRSPAVTKSATLYYPYWLAYCVGVLEKDGFNVNFVDASAMGLDRRTVCEIAEAFKPELTVVDTTTGSIYNDVEVAVEIKNITGSRVIMVGTHASATADETINLHPDLDAVAIGEYDYTVRDFARVLRDGGDFRDVSGIVGRVDDTIVKTPSRPYLTDLDELPFVSKVYKNHFSESIIRRYFYGECLHPMMTIISGRGCPHQCAYCVYPQVMTGHSYRYRSVKNLVDELEYIQREFPYVKEVFIEDDTLTIHADRCRQFADEIRSRKLKITWSANSRADVDGETLRALGKAGCRLLCVGFESGDQNVLDNMQKKLRLEKVDAFMRDAKRAGIRIHGCFLVGNPGETRESLAKTLDLALRLNPDTAQFYPIMIYPGTKAYQWASRKGYIKVDRYDAWLTEEGLHNSVVSTPDLSWQDLVSWCDNARRRFYLRPNYFAAKVLQGIFDPREFGRLFKGFNTLVKFLFRDSLKTKSPAVSPKKTVP